MCDNFGKENRFEFGYILVGILQRYTMHNLPHRTQVMTAFSNEIPLKKRQGSVFHFRINISFACSKRKKNCKDFYNSVYPGEPKMCLDFMSFRAPSASLKQKNSHNSSDMQPIITKFQVVFKFMKRHLLTIVSK